MADVVAEAKELLKDASSEDLEAVRQYCTSRIEGLAADRAENADSDAAATPPADTASHGPNTPKQ